MFLNFYRCPDCEKQWTDTWSATCDDDCPKCGARNIEPYKSEDAAGHDPIRAGRLDTLQRHHADLRSKIIQLDTHISSQHTLLRKITSTIDQAEFEHRGTQYLLDVIQREINGLTVPEIAPTASTAPADQDQHDEPPLITIDDVLASHLAHEHMTAARESIQYYLQNLKPEERAKWLADVQDTRQDDQDRWELIADALDFCEWNYNGKADGYYP